MTNLASRLGLAAVAAMMLAAPAAAAWPEKPITIIAPYSPGGGLDPVVRHLAKGLEERLKQPILVDFRPGASSTIGTKMMLDAPADGYTLLISPTTPIVDVKFSIPNLPYDIDDIQPIAMVTQTAVTLIANSNFKPNSLSELIEHAKANPGKVNVATSGVGGGGHSAVKHFEREAGIELNVVPYKGAGDMQADLLSGVVDIGVGFPASFLPGVEAGRLKLLGFMEPYTLKAFPELQNFTDVGVDPVTFPAWFILSGKKGTPDDVLNKILEAANDFLSTEEGKSVIENLGYEVVNDGTIKDAEEAVEAWKTNIPKLIEAGVIVVQ